MFGKIVRFTVDLVYTSDFFFIFYFYLLFGKIAHFTVDLVYTSDFFFVSILLFGKIAHFAVDLVYTSDFFFLLIKLFVVVVCHSMQQHNLDWPPCKVGQRWLAQAGFRGLWPCG